MNGHLWWSLTCILSCPYLAKNFGGRQVRVTVRNVCYLVNQIRRFVNCQVGTFVTQLTRFVNFDDCRVRMCSKQGNKSRVSVGLATPALQGYANVIACYPIWSKECYQCQLGITEWVSNRPVLVCNIATHLQGSFLNLNPQFLLWVRGNICPFTNPKTAKR